MIVAFIDHSGSAGLGVVGADLAAALSAPDLLSTCLSAALTAQTASRNTPTAHRARDLPTPIQPPVKSLRVFYRRALGIQPRAQAATSSNQIHDLEQRRGRESDLTMLPPGLV